MDGTFSTISSERFMSPNPLISLADLNERKFSWSLACDNALLENLMSISKRMTDGAEEILQKTLSLSLEVELVESELEIVTNKFLMISNTNFTQNKVEEFSETDPSFTISNIANVQRHQTKAQKEQELFNKMKEALKIGVRFTKEHKDAILNDETKEDAFVLNLPPLIGSAKFYSTFYNTQSSDYQTLKKDESIKSFIPNSSSTSSSISLLRPESENSSNIGQISDESCSNSGILERKLYMPPPSDMSSNSSLASVNNDESSAIKNTISIDSLSSNQAHQPSTSTHNYEYPVNQNIGATDNITSPSTNDNIAQTEKILPQTPIIRKSVVDELNSKFVGHFAVPPPLPPSSDEESEGTDYKISSNKQKNVSKGGDFIRSKTIFDSSDSDGDIFESAARKSARLTSSKSQNVIPNANKIEIIKSTPQEVISADNSASNLVIDDFKDNTDKPKSHEEINKTQNIAATPTIEPNVNIPEKSPISSNKPNLSHAIGASSLFKKRKAQIDGVIPIPVETPNQIFEEKDALNQTNNLENSENSSNVSSICANKNNLSDAQSTTTVKKDLNSEILAAQDFGILKNTSPSFQKTTNIASKTLGDDSGVKEEKNQKILTPPPVSAQISEPKEEVSQITKSTQVLETLNKNENLPSEKFKKDTKIVEIEKPKFRESKKSFLFDSDSSDSEIESQLFNSNRIQNQLKQEIQNKPIESKSTNQPTIIKQTSKYQITKKSIFESSDSDDDLFRPKPKLNLEKEPISVPSSKSNLKTSDLQKETSKIVKSKSIFDDSDSSGDDLFSSSKNKKIGLFNDSLSKKITNPTQTELVSSISHKNEETSQLLASKAETNVEKNFPISVSKNLTSNIDEAINAKLSPKDELISSNIVEEEKINKNSESSSSKCEFEQGYSFEDSNGAELLTNVSKNRPKVNRNRRPMSRPPITQKIFPGKDNEG